MILIYGECGRQSRETARTYARRYPEREQSHYKFFMTLESGLQKNGQFRPKPAGTYLFIKTSGNTILNFFYHYFHTGRPRRINSVQIQEMVTNDPTYQYTNRDAGSRC